MDSPLSLALLHDIDGGIHVMALVFLGHCMAIYVISNFTGRSPILSFKQRLLSLGTQQL